jgi:hypothetical protein
MTDPYYAYTVLGENLIGVVFQECPESFLLMSVQLPERCVPVAIGHPFIFHRVDEDMGEPGPIQTIHDLT